MTSAAQVQAPPQSLFRSFRFSSAWFGVMPFCLFAVLFLFWPAAFFVIGSFQDASGEFTLKNIADLFQPAILNSYWLSIQVSVVTAVGGGIFGFLLAYAAILGGLPRGVRSALLTFSGVASNFAGVPLAFSFIATLGRTGLLTVLLSSALGLNLYESGFSLYNFWGL